MAYDNDTKLTNETFLSYLETPGMEKRALDAVVPKSALPVLDNAPVTATAPLKAKFEAWKLRGSAAESALFRDPITL